MLHADVQNIGWVPCYATEESDVEAMAIREGKEGEDVEVVKSDFSSS